MCRARRLVSVFRQKGVDANDIDRIHLSVFSSSPYNSAIRLSGNSPVAEQRIHRSAPPEKEELGMNGVSLAIRVSGLSALLLAGCVSSRNTRLPSLAYGDPKTELRSYVYQDPYPEGDVGPLVERPRGLDRQRSEPRRTMERANLMPGAEPESQARYPNVVHQ
jgi:hypothetical protein